MGAWDTESQVGEEGSRRVGYFRMGWGLPERRRGGDGDRGEAGGRSDGLPLSHGSGNETQGEEATLWGWGHSD